MDGSKIAYGKITTSGQRVYECNSDVVNLPSRNMKGSYYVN